MDVPQMSRTTQGGNFSTRGARAGAPPPVDAQLGKVMSLVAAPPTPPPPPSFAFLLGVNNHWKGA